MKSDIEIADSVVLSNISVVAEKAGIDEKYVLPFLGLLPQHMEVPRLGVESEL